MIWHEDADGNYIQPIPANAPPTQYVPPPVTAHNATRAHVDNTVTPTPPAARPNIIGDRPSSNLTFGDAGGDGCDGMTRRAAIQVCHLDLIDSVDNGHTLAGVSMDRLDTLMNRMGDGVNQTQMLHNLGGFMAAIGGIGGANSEAQRDEAFAITGNILAALNRQYSNGN